MEKKLLEILVCPICKGRLSYDAQRQVLVCRVDDVSFAIQEGIPKMLMDEVHVLHSQEKQ